MSKTDVQLSMHYITNSSRDEDYKNGGSLQQGTDGGNIRHTHWLQVDAINKTFTIIPSSDATVIGEVNRTFNEINGYFLNTILFTCRAFVNLLLFVTSSVLLICWDPYQYIILTSNIHCYNWWREPPMHNIITKAHLYLTTRTAFLKAIATKRICLRLLTAVRVCPSTHVHAFSTYTSHNTEVLQL